MDVFELVDFASFAGRGRTDRANRARHLHLHALARRCHEVGVLLLANKVGIRSEVEPLLAVVLYGRHGTLTHTLRTLALGAADLLLNSVRVVVLNLLKRLTCAVYSPCSLAGFFFERIWQIWPIEVNIDDISSLGVVTGDLLEISLGSLASVL